MENYKLIRSKIEAISTVNNEIIKRISSITTVKEQTWKVTLTEAKFAVTEKQVESKGKNQTANF